MNKQDSDVNKFLQPLDAPVAGGTTPTKVVPWKWGANQYIQTKRINTSQTIIKRLPAFSNQSVSVFTLGAGSSSSWTSTDVFKSPHQQQPMLTNPYVAFYEGSWPQSGIFKGSAQIYPSVGSGVTPSNYAIWSAFDFNQSDGTTSYWTATIVNNSGAPKTITFASQSMYIDYVKGQV